MMINLNEDDLSDIKLAKVSPDTDLNESLSVVDLIELDSTQALDEIDFAEVDLIPEIKQQLILLNQETNGLETEIKQLKNVYEELELLKLENKNLKQRLFSAEEQHAQFVISFKEFMKKRDDALCYLLQEVKGLKVKMNELRSSLSHKL